MSSLSLQEEEFARTLKGQGKSTQEILSAIAQKRTGSVAPLAQDDSAKPKFFNMEAAGQEFNKAADDINLASQSGSTLKTAGTAVLQGGLAPFRATGAGLFGTETGEKVAGGLIEKMTALGEAITPDSVQNYVGKVATDVIEGYEAMPPQEQLNQRNKLAIAEILSYYGGGSAAKDAIVAPTARLAERGAKEFMQGADDFKSVITGAQRSTPAEPIVAPVPQEIQDAAVSGFSTAIKPNLTSKQTPQQVARYNAQTVDALETIANNADNLRLIDDATGDAIKKLPENLKDFVDAIEQTKKSLFQQYDDMAQRAGQSGAFVDAQRIANSLDEIINSSRLKVSSPESIRYAEQLQNTLRRSGKLSAQDAQDIIADFNNKLSSFYSKATPEGFSQSYVNALVANQLRSSLDEAIEGISGPGYQALKRQYSSLKTIERDVIRAYNRDARRNTKGLVDFTDVLSGGQVVSGILSANPALIGQGIAQKLVAGAIKMTNDPNRKVRQIFEQLGKYRRPDTGMQFSSRKQLPEPQEGALRSQVSSGAPIAQGGETATGKVTLGGTERAVEGGVKQPSQTGTFRKQAERFKSPEAFVNAVKSNPAWLKKFEEMGVTPEQISKMVFAGGGALGLVYLMDSDIGAEGFMILGSILGGASARKTFVDRLAKNANEADLVELATFSGAYKSGAFKTDSKGFLTVVETKRFTQKEAQRALDGALRRAEDFPVISEATLKELHDVFEEVLKKSTY